MSKFYDDLARSFSEILDYLEGKITLHSEIIELPESALDGSGTDEHEFTAKPEPASRQDRFAVMDQ